MAYFSNASSHTNPGPAAELTAPLRKLVLLQVVLNTCQFIALPFLVIALAAIPDVGLSGAGIALGTYLGVSRIAPLTGGPLAEWVGLWTMVCVGLAMRGLSLLMIPMINSLASSIAVAAFLGVGVAIYETGIYGVMAAQPRKMREVLLMANIQALNIGCVLGPVFGFVFVLIAFNLTFILPAFVLMLLAGYCALNRSPEYHNSTQDTVVASASRVLKDKKFLWMCASLIPFWALFAQLFGALPVLIVRASGSDAMAGSVIFLNGFVGFFAVSVYAWLTTKLDARALAIAGCLIGAIATWFLGSTVGLIILIFLIGLFSVAETFVTTAADILTSRYADGRSTGSYFSVLNVSIGIGSALGAPLGMMAISQTSGVGFMMIGVTGVLSALLLFWHR